MARDFDPDHLSFSDVVRILLPLACLIALLVLATKWSEYLHYGLMLVMGIFVFAYTDTMIRSLPKDQADKLLEKGERRDLELRRIPILGPVWIGLRDWGGLVLFGVGLLLVIAKLYQWYTQGG